MPDFWISTFGGVNDTEGNKVAVDSADNVLLSGNIQTAGAGLRDLLITKTNSLGDLQWARALGGSSTDGGEGITVDSSDNVIVTGFTESDGAGGEDILIAKYNSSGTLQWDRTLGGSGTDTGYGVATDSSDNIIISARTNSLFGNYRVFITKYNSSGTVQWARNLGGGGGNSFTGQGQSVAVDSSDNIIVCGLTSADGAGSNDFLVAKYNSSGTLQWDVTLGSTGSDGAFGVAIDSSDNIIVCGNTTSDGAGGQDFLIAKYNSSGTLQWDRTLGGSGTDSSYGVATDSSDNIFVTGYTTSAGDTDGDFLIAKYNSSGAIQWQRTLSATDTDISEGIAIDSSGNVLVAGFSKLGGSEYFALLAKLPNDGTGTGVYGPLTYQASSLTDAAAVLTAAPAVLTDNDTALSDAAAVLTDTNVYTRLPMDGE